MKIRPVTILEVEYIAYDLAKKLMEWDEPIPAFGTRYPGRLESCLAQPFQTYGHKLLYKGLMGKAAVLFYLMTKNHPFENGNKRIAVATLLYFLMINNKWLKTSNASLYKFAKEVAESNPRDKDSAIVRITEFLEKFFVDFNSIGLK